MGRYNFTALRMRRQALANLEAERIRTRPVWLDVTADIPPAQIYTRQQPKQHPLTKIRTKTISSQATDPQLPSPTIAKNVEVKASRLRTKASRAYQPLPIRYEEDELRRQFYSDHPWELARPRVVLETDGKDERYRDYSRNVRSPNAPLNGESVVQRQLYLLHNVPDISESLAYDIARKEFYAHRLREDIERRVAAEEAQAVGADLEETYNQRSLQTEDQVYEDWERWSKQTVLQNTQRNAAFIGQQVGNDSSSLDLDDELPEEQNGQEALGSPVMN